MRLNPHAPCRPLTEAEMALARSVFGDRIDYSLVHVVKGRCLPWQGRHYVVVPGNHLYWPNECGELACNGTALAGLFIHEMAHVMQYQQGTNLILRGGWLQLLHFLSFKRYDPYHYVWEEGKPFGAYNIEQQGEIARNIFLGRHPNIILKPFPQESSVSDQAQQDRS